MNELESAIARMVCVGFDGLTPPKELDALLDRGVCAVVLLGRNYESPAQIAELCRQIKMSADRPILICIDQEGGRVQRMREPFEIVPSMRQIGASGDVERARSVGRLLAKQLRSVHIDMNLAPVLDVDSNPANPVIGERSLGSDPNLVARFGCALIDGLQSSDVAACGKHFPGHGDTILDSHFDLPRLSHAMERLERVELPPFHAAIDAGVAAIMTAHVIFEALDATRPATMSPAVVSDLLRRDMGFAGVVISDDLEMKAIADHFGVENAAVAAAMAGVDLMLICHSADVQHRAIDATIDAAQRGTLPQQRIEESNRRLDVLFERFVHSPRRVSASRR